MLTVKLICAGKLKEKFYLEACAEYLKRVQGMCRPEVCEITEQTEAAGGLEREAQDILAAVPKGAFVVAMCIEGKMLSSEGLAARLQKMMSEGVSKICFIIGSSNGLSDTVKQRADLRLSMSEMTFPHHLARVMVLEQIYRALSINNGGKYHK